MYPFHGDQNQVEMNDFKTMNDSKPTNVKQNQPDISSVITLGEKDRIDLPNQVIEPMKNFIPRTYTISSEEVHSLNGQITFDTLSGETEIKLPDKKAFEQVTPILVLKKRSKKRLGISGYVNSESISIQAESTESLISNLDLLSEIPLYTVTVENKKYCVDLQLALLHHQTSGRLFTERHPLLATMLCSPSMKRMLQPSILSVSLLKLILKKEGGSEETCRWIKAMDTQFGRGLKLDGLDLQFLEIDSWIDVLKEIKGLLFEDVHIDGFTSKETIEPGLPVVAKEFVSKMKKISMN